MPIANGLLYDQQVSDNVQGAAAMPSIPREAILDTVPRSALAATKKIVNLVPITAGSVSANQTVQFLIPQRNLMKASSAYLKFKVEVTGITNRFSFSGSLASAASLINNMTIQAGGVVLESLQNYHLWHNNVLSWAHQGNDELAVEALCSGSKLPQTASGQFAAKAVTTVPAMAATAASTASAVNNAVTPISGLNNYNQGVMGYSFQGVNVGGGANIVANNATMPTFDDTKQFPSGTLTAVFSIPILSGVLNPKESQLIPLQFINGGMLLTIQTNPASKAFFEAGTSPSASAAYTLSDMELCYAEITPAPEYILRIREEMMAGKMIKIEAQSYQQYNVASQQSVRQNFNVNLSSVSSIFWGRTFGSDSTVTSKCFAGFGTDSDQQTRYEIYLDNVLLFNSSNQLNSIAVQIRQLQEALASTVSDYTISPFVAARGNNETYTLTTFAGPSNVTADNTLYTSAMLWGLSTKLFASNSTSMDGTPIGVLTINFVGGNSVTGQAVEAGSANNLWYIYVVYDYIYLVDATGSVSKNQ
jgi:hypothetical protein